METLSGVVRVADLVHVGSPVIEGRQFVDAEVHGPAILIPLRDVHFGEVRFDIPDGRPESLLWPWDTASRFSVVGGIALIKCEFRRCTMLGIGLAGPPDVLDVFGPKLGVADIAPLSQTTHVHIEELIVGDKTTTGDIHAAGGSQVVIGRDIVARLEQVGHTEAAHAIERYRQLLDAVEVDTPEKEAQLQVLNEVGIELTKPTPNRSKLRLSLAALREGAQTSTSGSPLRLGVTGARGWRV